MVIYTGGLVGYVVICLWRSSRADAKLREKRTRQFSWERRTLEPVREWLHARTCRNICRNGSMKPTKAGSCLLTLAVNATNRFFRTLLISHARSDYLATLSLSARDDLRRRRDLSALTACPALKSSPLP